MLRILTLRRCVFVL